jgi:hypothetical protein
MITLTTSDTSSHYTKTSSWLNQNPASSQRSNVGIDTGMIATLMFLQKRSRDLKIRKRAIAVLSHIHRIDSDLEASNSATLGNVLIKMEESGLASATSCGDIPEPNRLWLLSISRLWKTGQRRVRFVKPPYEAELGAAIVELWGPVPKVAKGQEYQQPGSVEVTKSSQTA